MEIKRVCGVYYSATKNTEKVIKKIVTTIASTLQIESSYVDYTNLEARKKHYYFQSSDFIIYGTSVYAGRIPNKMLSFVSEHLHGNSTLFVPVVTYGNRSYDEALKEAWVLLEKQGFIGIAAAAIPCQHSFTDKLAYHRPNATDLQMIATFSETLAKNMQTCSCLPQRMSSDLEIGPYYIPRKEDGTKAMFLKAKPKTDESLCTHCHACASVCPMQAISYENETEIIGTCIKCQACIKVCEQQAKYFDDEAFLSHVRMLEKNYREDKEANFYSLFDAKKILD